MLTVDYKIHGMLYVGPLPRGETNMAKLFKSLAFVLAICNVASANKIWDATKSTGAYCKNNLLTVNKGAIALPIAGVGEYVRYCKMTAGLTWTEAAKFLISPSNVEIKDEKILSGLKFRRYAVLGSVATGTALLIGKKIYGSKKHQVIKP